MSVAAVESLYEQALLLSPDERELLASRLLMSVEKEPGYDEAWKAELERRWAGVERGESIPKPSGAVERRIFGP